MVVLGELLMGSPPAGPGADRVRRARGDPDEPDEEPPDFRDRDRDVVGTGRPPVFRAPIVNAANATRARVIWRYQPCQLRTS